MQLRKTVFYILLLVLIVILGVGIFLNWKEVKSLLGLSSAANQVTDWRGQPISFSAGGRNLSIPVVFSREVLDYLKKENTEAGNPVKVDQKGNSLPFGIP